MASDGHATVAWVENARGVRNIWCAEAPAFEPRRITNFTEDDGLELSDLAVTSTQVFFVRGSGNDASGEYPNPTHRIEATAQSVWVAPIASGPLKVINAGVSPVLSHDGRTLAFISSGQIWTVPTNLSSPPKQLIHERGSAANISWSPEDRALAFESHRDRHTFIATFHLGSKSLVFLDPGTDFDGYPEWSPDSQSVAFIRVPYTGNFRMYAARREAATPWSIRIANAQTGEGHELWHASPGSGSYFSGLDSVHQLFLTSAGLAFAWESSGWRHIYLIPANSSSPRDLTPGIGFEVESAALTPDRQSLVVMSNQNDVDRRHLWRVTLNRGALTELTPGNGSEWSPTPLDTGVALIHSGAIEPARAALLTAGKLSEWTAVPPDFPAAQLVKPQQVTYLSPDGLTIHAQCFKPAASTAGPAVIFVHGGSRRQMLLDWHYMEYYNHAYAMNQFLASRGFIVLSINYRSGIGYGLDFREALNYGPMGASEYNDVLGAHRYLASRPDVDPKRIAIWGGSYGGYLTALALARNSDFFAAGADFHGVHEWSEEVSSDIPLYEAARRQAWIKTAHDASPMASVSSWRSPVLLIHGDHDPDVNFRQTLELADALRQQHVEFKELVFPDERHELLLHSSWLAAYQAAADFLAHCLKIAE